MQKIITSIDMPNDIKYLNWLSNKLYIIFMLLFLGCVAQFAITNKVSNLNNIIIKGDVTRNDAISIRNQINLNTFGNFYNIDLIKTKKTFESISWVNHAIVRRVFPNQILVKVSEYNATAIWGNSEDLKLVDDRGVLFEANADEREYEKMPQFIGPDNQSKLMLEVYKSLITIFEPLQYTLKTLELNARGSWIAVLDNGAHIELGRGNALNVKERASKFAESIESILKKVNKKMLDIQYIDLRHGDGYAMRVQGVNTLDLTAVNTTTVK